MFFEQHWFPCGWCDSDSDSDVPIISLRRWIVSGVLQSSKSTIFSFCSLGTIHVHKWGGVEVCGFLRVYP